MVFHSPHSPQLFERKKWQSVLKQKSQKVLKKNFVQTPMVFTDTQKYTLMPSTSSSSRHPSMYLNVQGKSSKTRKSIKGAFLNTDAHILTYTYTNSTNTHSIIHLNLYTHSYIHTNRHLYYKKTCHKNQKYILMLANKIAELLRNWMFILLMKVKL